MRARGPFDASFAHGNLFDFPLAGADVVFVFGVPPIMDRVARKVFAGNGDWFINVDQPTRDVSVNRILLDLTQRETTNQSTKFANVLLDRMSGRVDLLRRSHRDANFMVLLAPDVPAVLLEMGFITNPVDQERLSSPDQRKVLASAITEAIDNYFTHVSRLAAR